MQTVGIALRCQFGISNFPIRESSIKASSAELTARSAALSVLSYQLMGGTEFRDCGTAPEAPEVRDQRSEVRERIA
jgi:hypothetical protein